MEFTAGFSQSHDIRASTSRRDAVNFGLFFQSHDFKDLVDPMCVLVGSRLRNDITSVGAELVPPFAYTF
jgi:hypothetical protein